MIQPDQNCDQPSVLLQLAAALSMGLILGAAFGIIAMGSIR